MNFELSPIECRVLGCLIEKSTTTPEHYPLTLNSLISACNQKSNRDPVMDLGDDEVTDALDELRSLHFCLRVDTAGSRVAKFRYTLPDEWELNSRKLAILCELLIRGPQTPGELRTRGERMASFLDKQEAEAKLEELQVSEKGPFVIKLPIQPGKKEARYAHLFSGEIDIETFVEQSTSDSNSIPPPARSQRMDELEEEISGLKLEIESLKREFAEFRKQFD